LYILDQTFEPETSANHPKYLKTRIFSSFNKIFSEIQPSNGLGPGPDKVGQGGQKVLHLLCQVQKS